MYRRLKNLLGVSLIILAIVLSQLPMGAVQADTTEGVTEVTDVKTEIDDDASENTETEETKLNGDSTETDETKPNDGSTETEETKPNDNSPETDDNTIIEEQRKNQAAVIDNDDSSTPNEDNTNQNGTDGDGSTTTTTPIIYHTVTFDYGFLEVTSDITSKSVGNGMPIQIPEDEWKIAIKGEEKVLKRNQEYTIEGIVYKFIGWHTDRECTNPWEMSNDITKDLNLYAGWECADDQVILLTYYASGSSHEKQVVDKNKAGKRVVLPPNQPTKSGSTFIGWAEVVNGVDVPFNENEIPTKAKEYYARWEDKEYTVTFHANGGAFVGDKPTSTLSVTRGKTIEEVGAFPVIDETSYGSYKIADDIWYTDQECLQMFTTTTPITAPITLYRKWVEVTDKGFTLSADGRVLYSFNGEQTEVVIPSTVKIIATNAFSDMKNIESITLPAGISDIKANAFSGALNISRTISIYSLVDGSVDSKNEGLSLANTYEHFEYIGSAGGSSGGIGTTDSRELSKITCSLAEINRGIDDNGYFVYPQVYLPTDLPNGYYQMDFTEANNPIILKNLLQAAGYNMDSQYVYYMDISLKNLSEVEGYKPTWSSGTMSIKMPLPISWYGRDKEKIHMFTVNTAGTALEEVTISDISNNLFTFQPKHFSEFALVFTGKITTGEGGSSSGGNNTGGDGSSSGGNTSGGGSSSGGSSSSGSSSGSGSGSTGGGSSSTGGSNGSSTTTTTGTTPVVTTPNIPTVTPAPMPGTQLTVTPTVSTGGSSSIGGTTAHVKDSTPKTGDPLEYRSLLVCSFFSIGVLLLLIGNKKKTSSSSQYLQV